jgi:hypothetical protein
MEIIKCLNLSGTNLKKYYQIYHLHYDRIYYHLICSYFLNLFIMTEINSENKNKSNDNIFDHNEDDKFGNIS